MHRRRAAAVDRNYEFHLIFPAFPLCLRLTLFLSHLPRAVLVVWSDDLWQP